MVGNKGKVILYKAGCPLVKIAGKCLAVAPEKAVMNNKGLSSRLGRSARSSLTCVYCKGTFVTGKLSGALF